MKYLYAKELDHQVYYFADSYEWKRNTNWDTFARDFISQQLEIKREEIPPVILHKVLSVAQKVFDR
jgi:hypothetical protein